MNTYVPKPNTGTLWPNDYKRTEQHPDKRGDLVLDREFLRQMLTKTTGQPTVKIQLSGWIKVINGKDCLSVQASEPYVKPDAEPVRKAPAQQPVDDSDIPF